MKMNVEKPEIIRILKQTTPTHIMIDQKTSRRMWNIFNNWVAWQHMMPVPVAARSAAARLLRSWVRIPPGAWMFVCCECCVLSGSGLCDDLITRPEEFYRLWCVVVCDLETSRIRRPSPALGRSATGNKMTTYDARCTHEIKSRTFTGKSGIQQENILYTRKLDWI